MHRHLDDIVKSVQELDTFLARENNSHQHTKRLLESLKANFQQMEEKHLKTIDDLETTLANLSEENKTLIKQLKSTGFDDILKVPTELLKAETKKPTIAVIIGHDELVRGAYSKHLEKHEWEFYVDQVLSSASQKNADWYYFYRDRTGVKSAHDQIKKKINNGTKFDAILEFHFNAFNGYAYGAEILTNNAKKLAENLLTHWCNKTEIRNRGVKQRLISARGGYNISALARDGIDTPYLLLEPFFGTDAKDCTKIKDINIVEFFVNKTAELLNE